MKKIFLSALIFANLSVSSMACEFHDGQYFSRYEWPRVSYNSAPVTHANTPSETATSVTEKVESSSESKQPDFRYSRTKTSTDSEDNSNQELNSNLD